MRQRMTLRRTFEPDCPRQNASVKFGKRNIHGQITCGQAGTGLRPVIDQAGRKHQLKNRCIDSTKRTGGPQSRHGVVPAGRVRYRKTCQIEDHIDGRCLQQVGDDAA